jgi:hypothetical protein
MYQPKMEDTTAAVRRAAAERESRERTNPSVARELSRAMRGESCQWAHGCEADAVTQIETPQDGRARRYCLGHALMVTAALVNNGSSLVLRGPDNALPAVRQ